MVGNTTNYKASSGAGDQPPKPPHPPRPINKTSKLVTSSSNSDKKGTGGVSKKKVSVKKIKPKAQDVFQTSDDSDDEEGSDEEGYSFGPGVEVYNFGGDAFVDEDVILEVLENGGFNSKHGQTEPGLDAIVNLLFKFDAKGLPTGVLAGRYLAPVDSYKEKLKFGKKLRIAIDQYDEH